MIPIRTGLDVLREHGLKTFIKESAYYVLPISREKWTRYFEVEFGDTVVDVGANVGEFTRLAADNVGEPGWVLAVEPGPGNVRKLRENLEDYENVEIVEAAIMDYNGNDELYLNPVNSTGHSMIQSTVGAGHRATGQEVYADDSVTVDVLTLDKLCSERNIDKIDFLKMDIEGGEIAALEGAENSLNMTEKIVVEAYHPRKGHDMDGEKTWPVVDEILTQRGFRTKVTEDEWVYGER